MSTAPDTLLRETLAAHLDTLDVPPGDVARAMREGRAQGRARRTRRGVTLAFVGLTAVAVLGAVLTFGPRIGGRDPGVATFPSIGALDASDGLRVFADPGNRLFIGGREVDGAALDIDLSGAVTPDGVVTFDGGRPYLLGLDGETRPMLDGSFDDVGPPTADDEEVFVPTVRTSGDGGVAMATRTDGDVTLRVFDDPTGEETASVTVPCGTVCDSLKVDATDDGLVWGHTDDGAFVYDVAAGEGTTLTTGGKFRVADVRNGVLLHAGPVPPALADFDVRPVEGPVDASLSPDGAYVLGWSRTLEPTDPVDDPITLALPGTEGTSTYFTAFDTDGSVLVAAFTPLAGQDTLLLDCEPELGACTELDQVRFESDPSFVGDDM